VDRHWKYARENGSLRQLPPDYRLAWTEADRIEHEWRTRIGLWVAVLLVVALITLWRAVLS
jgi:hypothetical protein